jgi:magnesium-transporting ATPase (P-type)
MLKRKYIHKDTGDVLTFSEQVSWTIQSAIRNWLFVIAWTSVTIFWWIKPSWFGDDKNYVHWMNLASWLAVTVELIIGIAMIGQTKRDAQIIRHILKLEKQEIEHLQDLLENDVPTTTR